LDGGYESWTEQQVASIPPVDHADQAGRAPELLTRSTEAACDMSEAGGQAAALENSAFLLAIHARSERNFLLTLAGSSRAEQNSGVCCIPKSSRVNRVSTAG
jgi:hypothetical protein